MAEFTTMVTDILGIDLTLGATTFTLGGLALAGSILGIGVSLYRRLGRGR